jgi:hypothetical protein
MEALGEHTQAGEITNVNLTKAKKEFQIIERT